MGGIRIRLTAILAVALALSLGPVAALPLPVYDILDPEPSQDDCEIGADASDDEAAPTRLPLPADCVGVMTQRDYVDVFVFAAHAGQWVEVALDPDQSYPYMDACVRGPAGEGGCFSVNYPNIREGFVMTQGGDVRVTLSWSSAQDIQFNWRMRAGAYGETPDDPQDDCGTGQGASNSYANATLVATPLDCVGALRGADAWDWYRFPVLLGQEIDVTLDVGWADHEVCLFGPWGGYAVECSTRSWGYDESIAWADADSRGEWRVVVYRYAGDDDYRLTVNVHGAPSNEAPWVGASCPFLVELGSSVTCTLVGHDFDSPALDIDVRWQSGEAFTRVAEGIAPETPIDVTHTYETEGWRFVVARVADEHGAVAHSWQDVYVHGPPPDHDDCESGADAGDAFVTATLVDAPRSFCQGALFSDDLTDLDDWFAFDVPAGGVAHARLIDGYADLCLYAPDGAQVTCGSDVSAPAAEAGRWRVEVSAQSWGDSAYALALSVEEFRATGSAPLPSLSQALPSQLAVTAPTLDGFFVDLPFVASGEEGLTVVGAARTYSVRYHDESGAELGRTSGRTGEDEDWRHVPPGATRVLVQRNSVLDAAADPALTLVIHH